jgi:6-bladed beta-propeller
VRGISSSGRLTVALALAVTAFLVNLPSASAAIPFCAYGSEPGQCKEPSGIVVDPTIDRVYVADSGNDRINVFDEEGGFVSSFGTPGSGPGQLSNPRRLAVDKNPSSPNFHDVYVSDSNRRVLRFSSEGILEDSIGEGQLNRSNPPIAIGPTGNLYVIDSVGPGSEIDTRQVQVFNPAGSLIGQSVLGSVPVEDAAIDATGNLFVLGNSSIKQYELSEPSAILLGSFGSEATRALALAGGYVYVVEFQGAFRSISKWTTAGTLVRRFGEGEMARVFEGLAVGDAGDVFGSLFPESTGFQVLRISEPGPGPFPCCLDPDPGNTKATLKGQVNPEGKQTTYHFEYLSEAEYEANGNDFEGPNEPAETPESDPVAPVDPEDPGKELPPATDFELYPAEAEIGCATPEDPPQLECLTPGTAYRYRLVATNADGENTTEGKITTKRPFELLDTFATEAGTDSVRLNVTVNPLGLPGNAYFEYVDDAAYQADLGSGGDGFAEATRTPDLDTGSGDDSKVISAQLSGLFPNTTYHYRAVVDSASVSETGPERSVSTFPLPTQPSNPCPNAIFRTGPSAFLPGCRAYEMVSPVDKNGGDIKVLVQFIGFPARLDQAADSGGAFTYSSVTAFAGAQSAPWSSQYMARRGSVGWSTEAINPPRQLPSLADNAILRLDAQYRVFSPELDEAWLSTDADPPLDECAPEGFINLYRRDNATGTYEALVPRKPANSDKNSDYRLELQGVSTDGSHAIFRANAKLTKDASNVTEGGTDGIYQLYEHIRDPEGETCGTLRLISFKPDGTPNSSNASVGMPSGPAEYRKSRVAQAVSDDGSRVFFSTGLNTSTSSALYVRINADQPQSTVSGGECTEPDNGCTLTISPTKAEFWGAAADGSRVIYSVGEELLELDVDKALAGEPAKTLIAGDVQVENGLAASTADLSRIYVVTREAIDGEGEAGEPNLFLYEPGKLGADRYRLVATLSKLDVSTLELYGVAVGARFPIGNGVRLTPDGAHLAFVSSSSLAGYDSLDAATGDPTLQVYLYDAEADDLRCISCHPSGARPRGRIFEEDGPLHFVSAMMPPGESQTFAPRVLAPDGSHLFFESFEALLPRDTNGKADAYEWERAANQAECDSMGAELYLESSGGCLSLISTGKSPIDTEIADATPDGSSVFLRTAESLLPQDPGQVDVYVARVNGGFPQPPSQPAACEGEACQGPIVPPDDRTPGSLLFQGAGNVTEKVAKPKPRCRKGKVRRKGRCVKKKHRVNARPLIHNMDH